MAPEIYYPKRTSNIPPPTLEFVPNGNGSIGSLCFAPLCSQEELGKILVTLEWTSIILKGSSKFIFLASEMTNFIFRVFIRHWGLENSPATTQNSPAKFRLFPKRALPFHNNSPVTLHYSPATTILNEIPVYWS